MKAALKKGGNTRKPYDIRITIFILFIHARKKSEEKKLAKDCIILLKGQMQEHQGL